MTNAHRVTVLATKQLKSALGETNTRALAQDFKKYKEGKGLPATFGRDVPYNFTHHRSYLELQHLHYKPGGFLRLKQIQYSRTSDKVLVYCPGFTDSYRYLLITIINHWNHEKPNEIKGTDKDSALMENLEKIAEGFRNKN